MAQDHRRPGVARSRVGGIPAGHLPPGWHLDRAVRRPPKPIRELATPILGISTRTGTEVAPSPRTERTPPAASPQPHRP